MPPAARARSEARRGLCTVTALLALLLAVWPIAAAAATFTIRPYLQRVTQTSIVICWETDQPADAVVQYGLHNLADEAALAEPATRGEVTLTGLQPQTAYRYRVRVVPDGPSAGGTFRTAVQRTSPFVFGVYGDTRGDTEGHAFALDALLAFKPHFVINTGDLVELASEADWVRFWSTLNPLQGQWNLAAHVPCYPVVGNHDLAFVSEQGEELLYDSPGPQEAIALWRRFFSLPTNGPQGQFYTGEPQGYDYSFSERVYSFKYGVAKFIVLDVNDDATAELDTNRYMAASGAPSYHPGSLQYQWLERELADGRKTCAFTFVFCHHSPFSSSTHSQPGEPLSGRPLRVLNDLFLQYGVTTVFSGHDHCYERSLYKDAKTGAELNYIVAGGGGAPLYGVDPDAAKDNPHLVTHYGRKGSQEFSVIKVSIEPDEAGVPGKWWAAITPIKALIEHGQAFDRVRLAGFDPLAASEAPQPAVKAPPQQLDALPEHLQKRVRDFQDAYNSKAGDPKYKKEFDLNNDGKIDFRDLAIFSGRFPSNREINEK